MKTIHDDFDKTESAFCLLFKYDDCGFALGINQARFNPAYRATRESSLGLLRRGW